MRTIFNEEFKYREQQLAVMKAAETSFDTIFPFTREEVFSVSVTPSGFDRSIYVTLSFSSMDALRAVRAKLVPPKWEASTIGAQISNDSSVPRGTKRWRGEFNVGDLRVVYGLDTTDLGTCKLVECGTSVVRSYKVVCDDQPTADQP